jgi:hypothetical protein
MAAMAHHPYPFDVSSLPIPVPNLHHITASPIRLRPLVTRVSATPPALPLPPRTYHHTSPTLGPTPHANNPPPSIRLLTHVPYSRTPTPHEIEDISRQVDRTNRHLAVKRVCLPVTSPLDSVPSYPIHRLKPYLTVPYHPWTRSRSGQRHRHHWLRFPSLPDSVRFDICVSFTG